MASLTSETFDRPDDLTDRSNPAVLYALSYLDASPHCAARAPHHHSQHSPRARARSPFNRPLDAASTRPTVDSG
jgi:hypothetical protein